MVCSLQDNALEANDMDLQWLAEAHGRASEPRGRELRADVEFESGMESERVAMEGTPSDPRTGRRYGWRFPRHRLSRAHCGGPDEFRHPCAHRRNAFTCRRRRHGKQSSRFRWRAASSRDENGSARGEPPKRRHQKRSCPRRFAVPLP